MNTQLELLYELTIELAESDTAVPYERFEQLVDLRENVIADLQLRATISNDEIRKIELIGKFESAIRDKMCALRDEAAKELKIINAGRLQRTGYDSPKLSDSYFIDYRN